MEEKNLVLLVLLFAVIGRLIVTPLPFNQDVTAGADQGIYLHRIDVLQRQGWINWDRSMYGGMPFLTFYPPLSFYLGTIFDPIFGFKLLIMLGFVLAPLAFYYLLKEFKLSNKETLIATVIFAFTMYYNSFLFFGQLPSLLAIPLAFLFLKFFVRTIDRYNRSSMILSSILLAAIVLIQQIVSFMALLIALVYLASHLLVKFDLQKVKRAAFLVIPALLISSFWLIPTLAESKYSYPYSFFQEGEQLLHAIPAVGVVNLFSGLYVNAFTMVLSAIASFLMLAGFIKIFLNKNYKRDPEDMFWLLLPVFFLAAYLIAYTLLASITPFQPQRFIILWSLPASVLIAKSFNWKLAKYLVLALIAMQLILFFGMPMPMETKGEYSKFDPAFQYLQGKEGRFSFQPYVPYVAATVTDFRSGMYGLENEYGSFNQGLPKNRIDFMYSNLPFTCFKDVSATDRIKSTDFLNRYYIPRDTCKLVNNNLEDYYYLQDVHNIIVDKNSPEVVAYFENKAADYKKVLESNAFVVYEFLGNPKYVETDNGVTATYSIGPNKITINLLSDSPKVTTNVRVSESWYPDWKSDQVNLSPDNNGFITFSIDNLNLERTVILEYVKPDYYNYLPYASALGLVLLFLPIILKKTG